MPFAPIKRGMASASCYMAQMTSRNHCAWHDLMRATKTFRTLGLTTGLDNKLAIDKYADWDIFHNHSALDELQDLEAVLRFTTINVPGATTRSEEKPPRASPALLSPEVCNQIVTAWEKRPPSADRSTVVFCFDLDHCQALQAAFDARGHESFILIQTLPIQRGFYLRVMTSGLP
ncbi:hypothetical protein CPB85DRAFT_414043 [Mucidula mucida]|nr:hypothetical protein CPB85DRAFT_414043 [Mucidula mucida]